jgi:hypothetical protein
MCVFVRVYQGKTHTLIGNSADPGLMPRAVRELFAGLKAGVGEGREYLVRVSYVELYNEEIRDLLSTGPGGERLSVGDHPDMGAWSPPRVSPLPSPPPRCYGGFFLPGWLWECGCKWRHRFPACCCAGLCCPLRRLRNRVRCVV